MLEDAFKIYVRRLRKAERECLDVHCSSDVLDIQENEFRLLGNLSVKGDVYLSGSDLVVRLAVDVRACMPCSICNEEVELAVKVPKVYHIIPIDRIKGDVLDLKDYIRESVLLEAPHYSDCGERDCPKRNYFSQYLRTGSREEGVQTPFAELSLESIKD